MPTMRMTKAYRSISKGHEWSWSENLNDHESYLNLGGHRIATVRAEGFRFAARCPGSLVALRATRRLAKKAAIDAVRAWLAVAAPASEGEAVEDATRVQRYQ